MTNAFNWRGQPSIFTKDGTNPADVPTKNGLPLAQRVSLTVERRHKATGRNPGTIDGIARRPLAPRPDDRGGRSR